MTVGSARLASVYRRRMRRPAGTALELWSWLFLRVSGALLLVLAGGHMLIMHLINNVDAIDFVFVATRWQAVGWRVYDWLLLVLALVHGQTGLRAVIDDHVRSHPARRAAHVLNGVLLVGFLALGTLVVATFPASGMPGTR